MNETQCAVFQGIVYYYRANQVICRYQIALHDPVDLALLQRNSTNNKKVLLRISCSNTFFGFQKEPPDEPPKPSLSVVEPPESLSGWGGS